MNRKVTDFLKELKQIVLELYGTHLTYLVHETLKKAPEGMKLSAIGRELVGVYSDKREKTILKRRIRRALTDLEHTGHVAKRKERPEHQIPFYIFYLIKK